MTGAGVAGTGDFVALGSPLLPSSRRWLRPDAGLLVDEVHGFRRFKDREFTTQPPATLLNCAAYLAGCFRRGNEAAPVFGLTSLLESDEFLMGAAR